MNMRVIDSSVKSRINWFIYAHETFDVNIIANHLLDIPLRDIEAVVNENFTRMDERG